MKKINWKEFNRKGGPIAFGLCFSIALFFSLRQEIHLKYYKKFTIGTPIEKYKGGHGIYKIVYTYKVNGKFYKGQENYHGEDMDGRYYIKFSYKKPNISDILEDKPVSKEIKEAPAEGWNEIPQYIFEFNKVCPR